MRLRSRTPSGVTLEKGERTLAAAPTRGGSHVVATTTALHIPDGAGGFTRIPWEQVENASWKGGWLHVHEKTDHHVRLTEPGSVPEIVRERVTSTIAVTHLATLPGGGKVRIAGRRPAAGGDVRWTFLFEPGMDPS